VSFEFFWERFNVLLFPFGIVQPWVPLVGARFLVSPWNLTFLSGWFGFFFLPRRTSTTADSPRVCLCTGFIFPSSQCLSVHASPFLPPPPVHQRRFTCHSPYNPFSCAPLPGLTRGPFVGVLFFDISHLRELSMKGCLLIAGEEALFSSARRLLRGSCLSSPHLLVGQDSASC